MFLGEFVVAQINFLHFLQHLDNVGKRFVQILMG